MLEDEFCCSKKSRGKGTKSSRTAKGGNAMQVESPAADDTSGAGAGHGGDQEERPAAVIEEI
jgi:hypothetical protein